MERIALDSPNRNYRPGFYPNMTTRALCELLVALKNGQEPTRPLQFRIHPVTIDELREEIMAREAYGYTPGRMGCQ